MLTISLHPLYHRGKETIAIEAPNTGEINGTIRKLPGVKWSQTHRVWYLPWGKASYEAAVAALQPLAHIEYTALSQYLHKRSAVKATLVTEPIVPASSSPSAKPPFPRKPAANTCLAAK